CQCSMTFAPELPSPMIARPSESSSSVPNVIAITAGVRLKTLTIAVPSWIFFVDRASCVSMLNASRPQASATHADSTPRSSAICTRSTSSARSVGLPANPICKPSLFVIIVFLSITGTRCLRVRSLRSRDHHRAPALGQRWTPKIGAQTHVIRTDVLLECPHAERRSPQATGVAEHHRLRERALRDACGPQKDGGAIACRHEYARRT